MTDLAADYPSTLCSLGMRQLVMHGFLISWLRDHFARLSNLEDAFLRNARQPWLWRAGPNTGIAIESNTVWNPGLAEKVPALIVKRGAWTGRRLGINDEWLGGRSADGITRYSRMKYGSHTVFCVASSGGDVELLSSEVSRELEQFAPLIRWSLNLHRFEMIGTGAIGKLKQAADNYAVPVSVAYAFEETWGLLEHAPRLKHVDFRYESA